MRVLLIYGASRLYSSSLMAGVLAIATAVQQPLIGTRGKPTFTIFSGSWDGWFYRTIAEHGYPTTLPVDHLGHVVPNAWVFLPVFPFLERVLTNSTGMATFAAGATIAMLAGAGASVVLERLLRNQIGSSRSLRAVALFSFGPLSFVLQVAYAESLFLLLLFGALLLMRQHRYLTLLPLMGAAAFTRPGAIAIPAALTLQLAIEWWSTRRPPAHLTRGTITTVIGTAASLAWSPIADLVTGTHGAYIATELSWWTGWVGRPAFIPFTPWFLITSRWLGPAGVIAAALLAAALGYWILKCSPLELGTTVRAFSVMYVVYLAAVFLPQFSLPRLLMPLSPLVGAATFTATRARQKAWLIAAAALQPVTVTALWLLSYP